VTPYRSQGLTIWDAPPLLRLRSAPPSIVLRMSTYVGSTNGSDAPLHPIDTWLYTAAACKVSHGYAERGLVSQIRSSFNVRPALLPSLFTEALGRVGVTATIKLTSVPRR